MVGADHSGAGSFGRNIARLTYLRGEHALNDRLGVNSRGVKQRHIALAIRWLNQRQLCAGQDYTFDAVSLTHTRENGYDGSGSTAEVVAIAVSLTG